MATTPLNFSWVLDGRLAVCLRPYSAPDFAFLASQGIRAVVRLTTPKERALDRETIIVADLEDLHEPIRVLTPPTEAQLDRILPFIDGCYSKGNQLLSPVACAMAGPEPSWRAISSIRAGRLQRPSLP